MPSYDDEGLEVDDEPVAEAPDELLALEVSYVAALLARPDLLGAVSPDVRLLGDPTLRAMVNIVMAHGEAYTRPTTMLAALEALPQTVDGDLAAQVLSVVPDGPDVELATLLVLQRDIETQAAGREFKRRVDRAMTRYGQVDDEAILGQLREAIEWFDKKQVGDLDLTAVSGLDRMKNDPPKIRWKIGCLDLDEPFKGIGPDGQAGYGMSGQGELIVLAAPYGVGKSRMAYNWGAALLDQGASIDWVILEDDEFAIMTNLMAVRWDIETWKIEQYVRGELGFIGAGASEEQTKLENAIEWYKQVGPRIRTIDGANTKVNVFVLDELLPLLTLNKRLYGTTHVVIDYVQSLVGGYDTEEAQRLAQKLKVFAARNKVCVFEISQVSNETMKFGSAAGQVAAKGSGAWGEAAHVGIELGWDAAVGQRELSISLKKARKARRMVVYAGINEPTGRITAYRGTPMEMALPEAPDKKTSKRK